MYIGRYVIYDIENRTRVGVMSNQKENTIFVVTPTATKQITEFYKGRKKRPLRVLLNLAGCGASGLTTAMDDPTDRDETFDIDGHRYLINRKLLKSAAPIRIDFNSYGFRFQSGLDLGPQCPGCGMEGAFCNRKKIG